MPLLIYGFTEVPATAVNNFWSGLINSAEISARPAE
jgi:hypothetical protein